MPDKKNASSGIFKLKLPNGRVACFDICQETGSASLYELGNKHKAINVTIEVAREHWRRILKDEGGKRIL